MLSTGLVAIDSTIIATAVPSIVKDIGGFAEFPWLFSIYLLAQAVTTPIYGKLADLFGRKPIMMLGIAFFLAGSIMCGIAWNMGVLIAFRAVQGLGAGAVFPMSITIVGDIYTVEERARVQGYLASVWGISAVVGPTLGGVFSEYVSWRWIFFVNIPLALLAAAMIERRFHEKVTRSRPQIDYVGATVLTAGLTLLILGVLEGGQAWAWGSPQSIAILAVGALLLVAFGFVERRAPDPVLPLWVVQRRLLVTTSLASCGIGAIVLVHPDLCAGRARHRACRGGVRTRHLDDGLADRRLAGGQGVPANRLPAVQPDRCGRGGRRFHAATAARLRLERRRGRCVLLRDRYRHGAERDTVADRRAGERRLAGAWRRHRFEHVLPVDGQRGRRRGLRRDR
jgi:multidrug resistance protein